MTSLFLSDQPPVGLLGSISDRHVWQEVNSEDEFIGVKITHQTSLETTGSSAIMTFPNQGYGPNLEIRKPQVDFMTNGRDQKLCCRYWPLSTNGDIKPTPRALVFISHGFSEHLGLYGHVGEAFAREEILAFGHDHVGHGQSDGIRAYVESVDQYADDVREHCMRVKVMFPDIPIYIVGHSMGGMIVLRTALNHPDLFAGIIFQGPLIIPGPQLGPFDARVNSFRAAPVKAVLSAFDWFNPEMILGKVGLHMVTRDEEMAKMLKEDELRWRWGCKVRLLLAFVACLEDNFNLLSTLKVPFLILHGTQDSLCNVSGSRLLYDQAASEDKEIHEFPDAVHQLYLEIPSVRNEAIHRTVNWITDRIAPKIPLPSLDRKPSCDEEEESSAGKAGKPKESSILPSECAITSPPDVVAAAVERNPDQD